MKLNWSHFYGCFSYAMWHKSIVRLESSRNFIFFIPLICQVEESDNKKNTNTIQIFQLKNQTIKHDATRKIKEGFTKIGNDTKKDVDGKRKNPKDTLVKV